MPQIKLFDSNSFLLPIIINTDTNGSYMRPDGVAICPDNREADAFLKWKVFNTDSEDVITTRGVMAEVELLQGAFASMIGKTILWASVFYFFLVGICSAQPNAPKPFGPVPTNNQMRWQEMEYYAFAVHPVWSDAPSPLPVSP